MIDKKPLSEKGDFSWIGWTATDIAFAAKELIASKREAYERIKGVAKKERSFENTVYALEASDHIMWKLHALNVLTNVSPNAKIREAARLWTEEVEAALVDIEYDEQVFRAVKAYAAKKERLDAASARLLARRLRDFRRMGFRLSEKERLCLRKNLKRLSALSGEFSKNINEYRDEIFVSEKELEGLPEDFVSRLKRKGKRFIVGLDYPELNPFLESATDSKKRQELAAKALRRGGAKNMAILKEAVRLRNENAKILGYETHGHFRLETRMAKHPEKAIAFLRGLSDTMTAGVQKELQELSRLKATMHPGDGKKLLFSDIAFFAREDRKKRFSTDSQKIREYFPLENVKKEMFDFFGELFSLRFSRARNPIVWHESVELWEIRDRKTKRVIASFFLDLFPRKGKYGHAAVFEIVTGHRSGFAKDSRFVLPLAAMVANFPAPSDGKPSLLSHSEVVTLFHEFGHILHETLTQSRYRSQAGFSTAWDFVEAPSQMMEYFAWEGAVLKKISKHFRTGKSLPNEMIENLIRSKRHMIAFSAMRQMILALFDMELHTESISGELSKAYAQQVAKRTKIALPDEQLFPAGFGHLMGYDAGYYGYMWSKVFAADMFSVFKAAGVSNKCVGARYRKEILEKGSSADEVKMLRAFLQRIPRKEAFLKEMSV